jgi:hypothetical protein
MGRWRTAGRLVRLGRRLEQRPTGRWSGLGPIARCWCVWKAGSCWRGRGSARMSGMMSWPGFSLMRSATGPCGLGAGAARCCGSSAARCSAGRMDGRIWRPIGSCWKVRARCCGLPIRGRRPRRTPGVSRGRVGRGKSCSPHVPRRGRASPRRGSRRREPRCSIKPCYPAACRLSTSSSAFGGPCSGAASATWMGACRWSRSGRAKWFGRSWAPCAPCRWS